MIIIALGDSHGKFKELRGIFSLNPTMLGGVEGRGAQGCEVAFRLGPILSNSDAG